MSSENIGFYCWEAPINSFLTSKEPTGYVTVHEDAAFRWLRGWFDQEKKEKGEESAFNDDFYLGEIPPTFAEWISAPLFGKRGRYRIFKTIHGDYALQEINGEIYFQNVAHGDLDFIVAKHKKYTYGQTPASFQAETTRVKN